MFVDRRLVRNLFDVNVEDRTGRQIDGLRMHQIAFEENFDPVTIFSHGENYTGGVFERRNQLLAGIRRISHEFAHLARSVSASRMVLPDDVRGSDSRTTIWSGTLKFARLARMNASSSFSTIFPPGRGTIAAPMTCPRFGSGIAKTIVSWTPG